MGAVADLAAWKAGLANPQTLSWAKDVGLGCGLPRTLYSPWTISPGGAEPTTAEACTSDTAGALRQVDAETGQLYVAAAAGFRNHVSGTNDPTVGKMCLLLVDRLSHQGGISVATTTEQTTNLPTAALPRYTSGEGVWAMLEAYSTLGVTTRTATVTYTNQAGTSGRVTPTVHAFFNAPFQEYIASSVCILPLQSGDTGFRSVEGVTVTGGSTGTVGVTLFRPLLMVPVDGDGFGAADAVRGLVAGGIPEVLDGACLHVLFCRAPSSGASGAYVGAYVDLIEA